MHAGSTDSYPNSAEIPADIDVSRWISEKTTEELLDLALVEGSKLIEKFWTTLDDISDDSDVKTETRTDGELMVQQLLEACLRRLTNDNPDNEPEGQLEKYQYYFCWLQLGSLLNDQTMLQKAIDGASALSMDLPQCHFNLTHAHIEMALLHLENNSHAADDTMVISEPTFPWYQSIQSSIDSMKEYVQHRGNQDAPGHLQTIMLVHAFAKMILAHPEVYDLVPECLNICMWIVEPGFSWSNNWEYLMIEQLLIKLLAYLLEDSSYEDMSLCEQIFSMQNSLLKPLDKFIMANPENPELYERHGHILMQQIKLISNLHSSFISDLDADALVSSASRSFCKALLYIPSTDPKYQELQNIMDLFTTSAQRVNSDE